MRSRTIRFIALVLLSGLAFAWRALLLCSQPDPLGTDGYFYAVQVEDLISLGRLHVPDASWVYGFLALWHAALDDSVLAVELGSAALAACCVPAAYLAGRGLGRFLDARTPNMAGEGAAGWALALWAAASPTLSHLAVDFPKSLGFVAPALLCVWACTSRPQQRWSWIAAGGLGLVAAWAHRAGAGLLALSCLGLAIWWIAARPGLRVWVLGAACAALALFALAAQWLPGLLHPADLARLAGQLDSGLHIPTPFAYFAIRPTHPVQQVELGACWIALGLAVAAALRRPATRALAAALGLPLAVCLLPFWRADVLDAGYRLALLAPVPASLLAIVGLPAVRIRRRRWLLPALFAAGLCATPLAMLGADARHAPPYGRFRALVERVPRPLPELLIAHRGIAMLYDHVTGREAMAWAPEAALDRKRIGRLAWGVRDGEWLALLPQDDAIPQPVRLDPEYVYLREDVWEAFLEAARRDADPELLERLDDWRNPQRTRPAWLLRGRARSTP
ncbi:MAG: hypothetical protein JXR96_29315 [Deltaproteobacteria bacterium]|nr:hypothetical protein [Deltaproteobacteria bacterium]